MTSGRPLTDREQMHILRWANKKTWGQIADELANLAPAYGRRNPATLSMWYSRYNAQSKTINIDIPKSVQSDIKNAGLDDVALSFLLSSVVRSYMVLKISKPI